MNGIYGHVRHDGSPLLSGTLEAMEEAMAFWGVDGRARWQEGPAGMGCQFSFCTPESDENVPYHDRDRGWVLTAGAFLDNREDLIAELGVGPDKARSIADTELVRLAYTRWGEECVHHLTGDWHFAVWDTKERRLFLARDHHGNTGLYYTGQPGFFAFGSSQKALLALSGLPRRPNLLRLAQVLTMWPGDGTMTAYDGIYQLPPSHYLTVRRGDFRVRRYWYAEDSPPVRFAREEDYLEGFMEQYDRAVRVRLRSNSPVGAMLSGGLDSGTVSVLAAGALAEKGERLTTYTSVPLPGTEAWTGRHRLGDESRLARATADHAGNIDTTWIRGEGISPVEGIRRWLHIHDQPNHGAANDFWLIDLFRTARDRSHRVLLTGDVGNTTVSWASGLPNLLPCLLPGRWGELFRTFPELRRRHGLSMLWAMRQFLLSPAFSSLRNGSGLVNHGHMPDSAINPRLARSLDLSRLIRQDRHMPLTGKPRDPSDYRHKMLKAGRSVAGAVAGANGGAHGMDVRDPTCDKRLMEYCLGLPESCHTAGGMDRAVIRRAFSGILPDEVRLNRPRGCQAADTGYRIMHSLQEVEEAMGNMDRHVLCQEVLDLARMRDILESVKRGPGSEEPFRVKAILMRGLAAGFFLMRF